MALEAVGPQAAKNIVSGVGVGLILKSLTINYRVRARACTSTVQSFDVDFLNSDQSLILIQCVSIFL